MSQHCSTLKNGTGENTCSWGWVPGSTGPRSTLVVAGREMWAGPTGTQGAKPVLAEVVGGLWGFPGNDTSANEIGIQSKSLKVVMCGIELIAVLTTSKCLKSITKPYPPYKICEKTTPEINFVIIECIYYAKHNVMIKSWLIRISSGQEVPCLLLLIEQPTSTKNLPRLARHWHHKWNIRLPGSCGTFAAVKSSQTKTWINPMQHILAATIIHLPGLRWELRCTLCSISQ